MNEELKKEMNELGDIIDAKIEKASQQAIERADQKADETLKREIDNLMNKFNERMDAVEVAQKKNAEASSATTKSFRTALEEKLAEGALEAFTKGNANATTLEIKADMTTGADFTGDVIPPTRVPGYKYDPTRTFHMRDILAQGSTDSDVVRYVKESGYSDGNAPKNEGQTLGQSDFDMTAVSVPVEKIGTYFRISEEMMDSTPQLSAYLSARAPEKLLAVEDTQIVSGNGSAPNLNGLLTSATGFSGAGFASSISNANQFDVLAVALNQLAVANYSADYILLNPVDWHKLSLQKATTKEYLVSDWQAGMVPRIMGVPVIPTTAISSDKYIVGNFAQGAQLWIKDNVSLGFFREDGTNVRDGFVTVRCQERVTLATYLPNAFVHGDFSADITTIGA